MSAPKKSERTRGCMGCEATSLYHDAVFAAYEVSYEHERIRARMGQASVFLAIVQNYRTGREVCASFDTLERACLDTALCLSGMLAPGVTIVIHANRDVGGTPSPMFEHWTWTKPKTTRGKPS